MTKYRTNFNLSYPVNTQEEAQAHLDQEHELNTLMIKEGV